MIISLPASSGDSHPPLPMRRIQNSATKSLLPFVGEKVAEGG